MADQNVADSSPKKFDRRNGTRVTRTQDFCIDAVNGIDRVIASAQAQRAMHIAAVAGCDNTIAALRAQRAEIIASNRRATRAVQAAA